MRQGTRIVVPIMATICHVNSLWPSGTIWRHRSGSTLTQVMALCLMAPSHYLNQRWLLISDIWWHSPKSKFTAIAQAIILQYELINYSFKSTAKSPMSQWVQHKERLVTEHTKSPELIYYLIVIIITVTEEIHMVMIDLTCIKTVLKLVYM